LGFNLTCCFRPQHTHAHTRAHPAPRPGDATTDTRLLDGNHLVLATPQQWDMVSRRWKQRKAVQAVQLFIADELQLLGGQQGPTLEVIGSRMRYMSSQLPTPIRIVGFSHSLANAFDVGEWLGASSHATFNFGPGVRPVPLEIHMHGLDIHNFDARMQVGCLRLAGVASLVRCAAVACVHACMRAHNRTCMHRPCLCPLPRPSAPPPKHKHTHTHRP
jgi:hypothetical protein